MLFFSPSKYIYGFESRDLIQRFNLWIINIDLNATLMMPIFCYIYAVMF